jgi:hypothetical protein
MCTMWETTGTMWHCRRCAAGWESWLGRSWALIMHESDKLNRHSGCSSGLITRMKTCSRKQRGWQHGVHIDLLAWDMGCWDGCTLTCMVVGCPDQVSRTGGFWASCARGCVSGLDFGCTGIHVQGVGGDQNSPEWGCCIVDRWWGRLFFTCLTLMYSTVP